jgi:hypothetical protein
VRVHNGRVCRDGSPKDIVGVGEVDDYNLVLFVNLLTYTNKVIRFQSKCLCEVVPYISTRLQNERRP